jgi:hypothetical protein
MGGKAFLNVEPVPRVATITLSLWVSALLELRHSSNLDEIHEFYLGLMSSVRGGNPDNDVNLHELFVKNGLRWLGSTAKKDVSGDIDIAVSSKDWTYDSLLEFLTARFPPGCINGNASLNQIYTKMEYHTCEGSAWHQIDFMVGDIDLLSFTHWSPHPMTSDWSGSHRTELIKAVAKAKSKWTLFDDNGDMIGRIGYTLNHDKGLVHGARYATARKDGSGYVKKMVPVTEDNITDFISTAQDRVCIQTGSSEAFDSSCARRDMLTVVYTDPLVIAALLFGVNTTVESLNTYEEVVDAILANPELRKQRDLIWKLYIQRLNQIGQPIPSPTINELFTIRGLN